MVAMAHQDPSSWKEILHPLALAMAAFGGLGGLVRALVVKSSFRDGVRVVVVGAGTSFGLGALSPAMLEVIKIPLPADPALSVGIMTSSGFIIGVTSIAIVEWLIWRAKKRDE
jgi:hypothetical protein